MPYQFLHFTNLVSFNFYCFDVFRVKSTLYVTPLQFTLKLKHCREEVTILHHTGKVLWGQTNVIKPIRTPRITNRMEFRDGVGIIAILDGNCVRDCFHLPVCARKGPD